MGEYAKRKTDGADIKIGTCQWMYFVRWTDRLKITRLPGSLDPATCPNLYWRLPVADEDGILPGDYQGKQPAVRLLPSDDQQIYTTPETVGPGSFQMYHDGVGLLLNVRCYHGAKLPADSEDIRAHFNGKDPYVYELCGIKNHEHDDGTQQLLPLVRCRHCGEMFRDSWANVLPFIRDQSLRDRLTGYSALGLFKPAQLLISC